MKIELVHYYQEVSPWKQKESVYINTLIGATRLLNDMRFIGYGDALFDEEDTKHAFLNIEFPNEETGMDYSRKHSTCMVYDLPETQHNPGIYDKLILYHSNGHTNNGLWYSWIAINTKTGKSTQKTFIDHDVQDLLNTLNRWFYHIPIVETNKRILEQARKNSRKS